MKIQLKALNPRGEIETKPIISAPPIENLNGKKICLLKFGKGLVLCDELAPRLVESLKKRINDVDLSTRESYRDSSIDEIVKNYDGVVILVGFTGFSSAKGARDAARIEKLGTPVVFVVTQPFEANARFAARGEGMVDISLAVIPLDFLPLVSEIDELRLGDIAADQVIQAFSRERQVSAVEMTERLMVFNGENHSKALENMEKHFLQHGWSDGLPLIPPTEEAVDEMLEGTDLSRDRIVALVDPAGCPATVEKIAINAVMAGCRPQFMPVIIAAVEAITDPRFDLLGVQSTSCNMAPLLIISGAQLIDELNINNSFSTFGPGWRANATIGRAIRLIMMNLGHTWPGVNDMRTIGSPFKYTTLIAENEAAYMGAWDSLRVAEGFSKDQPTISVMPAMSWQPDIVLPEPPNVATILGHISRQGKVKHDRLAANWGRDNLVLLCTSTFDAIRREGISRTEMQQKLYESIRLPGYEFFNGRDPRIFRQLPEWIIEQYETDNEALLPLLRGPDSIKICVTGGPGPYGISYISTFGYGPVYFVTKPIKLPNNWVNFKKKLNGWASYTAIQ